MAGSYFAIVTCRNSEETIEEAMQSLLQQSEMPRHVIVVDDGSTDRTGEILKTLQAAWPEVIHVITNPDLGYDITRLSSNWNKALALAESFGFREGCEYHFIATDDIILEQDYCKKLLDCMEQNKNIVIVSGNYDDYRNYVFPHGAGRMVNDSVFRTTLYPITGYPELIGFESAVLYQARRYGYEIKVLDEARYEHVRPLGKKHSFWTFGAAMKAMGWHPLYVLGRFGFCFVTGKPIGRIGALRMLKAYMTFNPKENSGYNSPYDKDFRDYMRSRQLGRVRRFLRLK